MANRYVSVEPRHDIYEVSNLSIPSSRNEVKESMISVTYDFVDFTGQTAVYKDKVPRREAQLQQTSALAQNSNASEYKPYEGGGLNAYLNKKPSTSYDAPSLSAAPSLSQGYTSPISNYLSNPASNTTSYESSYKQSSIDSFSSSVPKY